MALDKAAPRTALRRWLPSLLVATLLHGCAERPAGSQDPSIFFPTSTERSEDQPDGMTGGRLVERDGCIFLELSPQPPQLVIWEHGWSIERVEPDTLRILDDAGKEVAELGELVELGGGGLSPGIHEDLPERAIGMPIPERCKPEGGYWLATKEVSVVSD